MRDKPEIGDIVAYNYGGSIAVGVVEDVSQFKRYGKPYTRYHVAMHSPSGPANWISKVENAAGIMVLPCFPWDNIHIIGSTDQDEGGEPYES